MSAGRRLELLVAVLGLVFLVAVLAGWAGLGGAFAGIGCAAVGWLLHGDDPRRRDSGP